MFERTIDTEPAASSGSAGPDACANLRQQFPNDFKTLGTSYRSSDGRAYRWPQAQHDPNIIVVHHTAISTVGDNRSGVEKMRALYNYHANVRNWGDVGYHYIIDDRGQIFEGRSGGATVVAAHVLCHNIGAIGIAMMGNFQDQQPNQAQLQSLKWLTTNVARENNIDVDARVNFRDKYVSTIATHGELASTSCPGTQVKGVISQIREHISSENIAGTIRFASAGLTLTQQRLQARLLKLQQQGKLLLKSSHKLEGAPGQTLPLTLEFTAPKLLQKRDRIALIKRSETQTTVERMIGTGLIPLRREIVATETAQPGETVKIALQVTLPPVLGEHLLEIGPHQITLTVAGRPLRNSGVYNVQTTAPVVSAQDNTIRVKLSYPHPDATVYYSVPPRVNGKPQLTKVGALYQNGNDCVYNSGNQEQARGVVRLESVPDAVVSITSWDTRYNTFRGILECQVIDGELTLINELPLEHYLWGLSEEPASEPLEKRKAIAVAARSYAAHYLQDAYRKFPGKPYDGSDSAAVFQKYSGYNWEVDHPVWVDDVKATVNQVVKYKNQIVKTPYYTSNDGRTRSPGEHGWHGFLFEEIFYSKPDPHCVGLTVRGHGVGMSGCGSRGMANDGKIYTQILQYYYPGTTIEQL